MTEQLDLIPPDSIRPPPKMPPGPIMRTADIANGCRYVLRRAWGAGPSILWHGLNPSRADAERDDPTIMREIGFSFRWGFGSMVKTNFWPFITPSPKELWRWTKTPEANEAWHSNMLIVRAEAGRASVCVAAWGAMVPWDYVDDFLGVAFFDGQMPAWKCLGMNADGSPIHTLARGKRRVPDTASLVDWLYTEPEDYH